MLENLADHLAAAVALPRGTAKVDGDFTVIPGVGEQRRLRRHEGPTRAVPSVDLHAHAESMEGDLVTLLHLQDLAIAQVRGAVIIARARPGRGGERERSSRARAASVTLRGGRRNACNVLELFIMGTFAPYVEEKMQGTRKVADDGARLGRAVGPELRTVTACAVDVTAVACLANPETWF